MVRVNHVGSEVRENRPQVIGPRSPVSRYLILCECRETSAWVGHDVTHAGHSEIERRPAELERVDLVSVQTPYLRSRFIDWHTDNHSLLMAGIVGMPDHRFKSDAASGQ